MWKTQQKDYEPVEVVAVVKCNNKDSLTLHLAIITIIVKTNRIWLVGMIGLIFLKLLGVADRFEDPQNSHDTFVTWVAHVNFGDALVRPPD